MLLFGDWAFQRDPLSSPLFYEYSHLWMDTKIKNLIKAERWKKNASQLWMVEEIYFCSVGGILHAFLASTLDSRTNPCHFFPFPLCLWPSLLFGCGTCSLQGKNMFLSPSHWWCDLWHLVFCIIAINLQLSLIFIVDIIIKI